MTRRAESSKRAKSTRAPIDEAERAADSAAKVKRAPSDPTPPTWRDPWAWIALLAIVPVLLHSRGAPLGEPVADDFDFLRWTLLLDRHAFFDGGGSNSFWRPLAHQVYYSVLGETILTHPLRIAALHVLLLAGCALLLYRMIRRVQPGWIAASAASFPLLAESSRALIAWPSHFVDLGSLFFALLALHEAAFRRMATALAALLASLLCKEAGFVAGLLLPWMPSLGIGDRRTRVRWAVASLAVMIAWGIAYVAVRRAVGLTLPHHLENNPEIAAIPWAARFGWAFWNSLRAIVSLPATPAGGERIVAIAACTLVVAALAVVAFSRAARARARTALAWSLWGVAWFTAFSAGLTAIYPIWAPYRSAFGAVGVGVTASVLLGAIHPMLLAALVAGRLAAFLASPGVPPLISPLPIESGAFIDFERIVRLQRLMVDTRAALTSRIPDLPPHARVVQHYLPRSVLYAFEGDKAIQLWYRDTTARWVSYSEFAASPLMEVDAIVEYQPHRTPQMALVDPDAMRGLLRAIDRMRASDWRGALDHLDLADSLQHDSTAAVFLGTVAAKRAVVLEAQGDWDGAAREARRGLNVWPENFDSRYVLASVAFRAARLDEAEAQLDTLLAGSPDDRGAAELRERVRAARASSGRPIQR
jgi:hypothetical protein